MRAPTHAREMPFKTIPWAGRWKILAPPTIDSRGEFPGWYPYAQRQWGWLEMPGQGRRHSVSADNYSGHTCTGLGGETWSRSGQPTQPHVESMEEDLQRELTEGKEGHGTAGRAKKKMEKPTDEQRLAPNK